LLIPTSMTIVVFWKVLASLT